MAEFKVGDVVRYGAYGECKILDRREEYLGDRAREFFILTQVKNPVSTIYVPVEKGGSFQEVKRALTVDEIKALHLCDCAVVDWDEDDKKRDLRFRRTFERGDTHEIVALLKAVCAKQNEMKAVKKKLRSIDLNAIKICEKILFDEFSRTFSLAVEDVIPIVLDGVMPKEKV